MKDQKCNKIIHYHCPRCKTFKVWELNEYIYCPQCTLTFYKKRLNEFDDAEILSDEELEEIMKVLSN
jgi:uncharacterized Zn finger protein (UPF0148 family)